MKKEFKALSCPVNSEDYKAMYELLINDLVNAGIPSHHLGYLETLYKIAILSLTTKADLNEKEVEIVINKFSRCAGTNCDMECRKEKESCLIGVTPKELSSAICSHFFKPVIKYPEKKYTCGEGHEDIECDITNCETCKFNNEVENIEYNKAISDMKQLNGEGGV